jgi:hypothetical protein
MIESLFGYPIGQIATLLRANEISELMKLSLTDMAVAYAKLYQNNGNDFVNSFIKYESVRAACSFAVNNFEKNIQSYEPDEKISNYVSKLKLDERQTRLLARTLKMIKLISSD